MVEEPPGLCPWGTMRVLPYIPEDQGPYFIAAQAAVAATRAFLQGLNESCDFRSVALTNSNLHIVTAPQMCLFFLHMGDHLRGPDTAPCMASPLSTLQNGGQCLIETQSVSHRVKVIPLSLALVTAYAAVNTHDSFQDPKRNDPWPLLRETQSHTLVLKDN